MRKQIRWLWLAVGWHAFLDAMAVISMPTWGVYITELLLGLVALVSLLMIFKLRTPEPEPEVYHLQEEQLSTVEFKMPEIDENQEKLEGTRFQ